MESVSDEIKSSLRLSRLDDNFFALSNQFRLLVGLHRGNVRAGYDDFTLDAMTYSTTINNDKFKRSKNKIPNKESNDSVNDGESSSKPKLINEFNGVEPEPFEIHFQKGFDESDPWLRPINLDKFDFDKRQLVIQRYRPLMDTGLNMFLSNLILIMRMCFGSVYKELKEVKMFKFYLETTGVDPTGISSNVPSKDTAANLRGYLFYQTLFTRWTFLDGTYTGAINGIDMNEFLDSWLSEVFEFLFKDPQYNTKRLGDMIKLHIQSAFSATTSGTLCDWQLSGGFGDPDSRLVGCRQRTVPKESLDRAYLNRPDIIKSLAENRHLLIKENLLRTALICDYIIGMSSEPSNYRILVLIERSLALSGFTKTDTVLSHRAQFETEVPTPDDPPYGHMLESVWHKFGLHMLRESGRYVLNSDQLTVKIPGFTTTKSAGGGSNVVEFTTTGLRGEPLVLKGRSKSALFIIDPLKALDFKSVSTSYTESEPGFIGTRHVPGGKMTRAIIMKRIQDYFLEIVTAIPLALWQTRKVDPSGNPYSGIGTPNDFHLGFDSALIIDDHKEGLYATGNNASLKTKILIVDMDFSAFDVHQKWRTTRRFMIDGLLKAIKETNVNPRYEVFENLSLSEIIELIWSRDLLEGAYFLTSGGGREELVQLDQLFSGELMTLNINNMTNVALTNYMYSKLRAEMPDAYNVKRRKQGDDSEDYYIFEEDGILNSDQLMRIATLFSEAAEENGHSLNVKKTVMRYNRSEFIKKTSIFGHHVPRNFILPMTSERSSRYVDVREFLKSVRSDLNTGIFRGFNSQRCYIFYYFIFLIKGNYRYRSSNKRILHYLSPAAFFCPSNLGGLGVPVGDVLGTNTDLMCAFDLFNGNSDLYNAVNRYASEMSSIDTATVARTLSKNIAKEVTYEGTVGKPMGSLWITKNVMPYYRSSIQLEDEYMEDLSKRGFPVPESMRVSRMAEQVIAKEASAMTKVIESQYQANQFNVIKALTKRVKTRDVLREEYSIVELLRIESRETGETIKSLVNAPQIILVDEKSLNFPILLTSMDDIVGMVRSNSLKGKRFLNYTENMNGQLKELSIYVPVAVISPVKVDESVPHTTLKRIEDVYNALINTTVPNYLTGREKFSYHPYPAVSPEVYNGFGLVGVRMGGGHMTITKERLLGVIRSIDPLFPRHYDTSSLLRHLSDATLLSDTSLLAKTLVVMGASPSKADRIASALSARASDIISAGIFGGLTWGDPLYSALVDPLLSDNAISLANSKSQKIINAMSTQLSMRRVIKGSKPVNVTVPNILTGSYVSSKLGHIIISDQFKFIIKNKMVEEYHGIHRG
jgi:hypothetical protein